MCIFLFRTNMKNTYAHKALVQECIPVGCVLSAAVAMCIPTCTGLEGVCPGGYLPGGVYPQHALDQTPLCDQNDRQV